MIKLADVDYAMCYDGSLEGFLTLVFQAYARHARPQTIASAECFQPALGQECIDVECDMSLAERVKIGLCNQGGIKCFERIKFAFLADVEGREIDIFDYIVLVMAGGRRAVSDPSNTVVFAVERLANRVMNEREAMYQFLRFELLENGVFFAVINPKDRVLPLIMPHFVDRFNTQPFLVYDEVHHMAGVYDMSSHYLVNVEELNVPPRASNETAYQQMWKTFYDSISNERRYNPDLRRSWMPKRYWRNLTEMKQAV